jgi:hypothetical protein
MGIGVQWLWSVILMATVVLILRFKQEIRVLLGRRIGVQVIEHETEADQQNIQAKSQKVADL